MRRISKKYLGKKEAKQGVMLVTILFIVAIAIIFISTALMISVASRSRIYTNAVDDQARLTLYSLSQSVWQAIYSQEISDAQLMDLAKNSAVITFNSDAAPGMGVGGSTAKAYFWTTDTENCSKIYIEFEVQIDGQYEYYTMVLQKNESPKRKGAAFQFSVELNGTAADLNSLVIGYVGDNRDGATGHTAYNASDNITFLHNPKVSNQDNFGWYTTLVTDGVIQFRDSVFTRDVIFLGPNAGVDLNGNQMLSQSTANFYFYGTNTPFIAGEHEEWWPVHQIVPAGPATSTTFTFYGNNYYFDRINDETGNHGFGNFPTNFIDQNFRGITGNIYYEDGVTVHGSLGGHTSTSFTGDAIPGDYSALLQTDPDKVDTLQEAIDTYHLSEMQTAAVSTTFEDMSYAFGTGSYNITDSSLSGKTVNVDLSGGSVYMYFPNGITLYGNSYIMVNNGGVSVDAYGQPSALYIVLGVGKVFSFGGDNCGVIDVSCFNAGTTDYFNGGNLNQRNAPYVFMFSLGSGGVDYQMRWESNNNQCFTGYVGFYPTSVNANDGSGVFYHNCCPSKLFYGRMAVDAIHKDSGNFIYMPYCPLHQDRPEDSVRPYRDGTDYNVLGSESGFFTYSA